MTDLADALSGQAPAEIEPIAEPQVVEPVVEALPEPEVITPEEPAAKPEPTMVPINALHESRGETRELRQRLEALESQQNPPPPAPDYFDNPEGAVQHAVAPVRGEILSTKLEMSRFHAEREFGKDTVEEALAYFDQNPGQSQALLKSPSPFHDAVEAFNKNKVAAEIGADPQAWMEKEREKIRSELQAEMVVTQAKTAAATPAPSMAGITGTGGGAVSSWAGPTSLASALK